MLPTLYVHFAHGHIHVYGYVTAARNNSLRTNYIKVTINSTPQSNICRRCGDEDKTIYHIQDHHHHHYVVPQHGYPDPLLPLLSIVHRLRQVFRATSRILTELLDVCSSWSSCFCLAICGIHRSISLMSSSLLLQQCPACLVCLTWIVFVMGGRWPYSLCLVGCCRQDLFNIALNIFV